MRISEIPFRWPYKQRVISFIALGVGLVKYTEVGRGPPYSSAVLGLVLRRLMISGMGVWNEKLLLWGQRTFCLTDEDRSRYNYVVYLK